MVFFHYSEGSGQLCSSYCVFKEAVLLAFKNEKIERLNWKFWHFVCTGDVEVEYILKSPLTFSLGLEVYKLNMSQKWKHE